MKAYDDLRKAFGKTLAARIVAASMIQAEAMEGKEGFEEEDAVLRFTIGMIKRMRRQAIENGNGMSWLEAVERLEVEQEEGQHYTFQSSLGRAFSSQVKNEERRIKARERGYVERAQHEGRSVWSVKVEVEAERLEAAMTEKAVDASDVALTLEGIFNKWTPKRLSWFRKVLAGVRRGEQLTAAQRVNITQSYAPEGVTATEFVELAVRYA